MDDLRALNPNPRRRGRQIKFFPDVPSYERDRGRGESSMDRSGRLYKLKRISYATQVTAKKSLMQSSLCKGSANESTPAG